MILWGRYNEVLLWICFWITVALYTWAHRSYDYIHKIKPTKIPAQIKEKVMNSHLCLRIDWQLMPARSRVTLLQVLLYRLPGLQWVVLHEFTYKTKSTQSIEKEFMKMGGKRWWHREELEGNWWQWNLSKHLLFIY